MHVATHAPVMALDTSTIETRNGNDTMTATIATLASELIEWATTGEGAEIRKNAILDAKARPLIDALKAAGHIPADHIQHVEWQGVWEFGHVPICHTQNFAATMTTEQICALPEHWICVERDGSVGRHA